MNKIVTLKLCRWRWSQAIHSNTFGAGFTLIEIILAIGIFVIASVSVLSIFLLNLKTQNKIVSTSEVDSDAQHIMELIANTVRTGTINYSYYGGSVDQLENELALTDSVGREVIFKKEFESLKVSFDGGTNWGDLLPEKVSLLRLDFYIYPLTDPFAQGSGLIDQPRVTLVLVLNSTELRPEESRQIKAQTTVSARVYGK